MPDTSAAKRASAPRFSVRYCEAVVAFMSEGYSLTAFAGEIGVSRATLDKWVKARPTFAAAVNRAQASRARKLEGMLLGTKGSGLYMQALKIAAPDEWPRPAGQPAAPARDNARAAVALPDNGRE